MAPQYTQGATQVYGATLEALGARGLSADKQQAVQDACQDALSDIYGYRNWTWKKRQVDCQFTASTPWAGMPSDFGSLASREIERLDPGASMQRQLIQVTDRDFWRERTPNVRSVPRYFRVTAAQAISASTCYRYVIEVAPLPDAIYTFPAVEYFTTVPTLTFTDSTGTVPDMPGEFFRLWKDGAAYRGARALGRHKLSFAFQRMFNESLSDAARRHDTLIQSDSPPAIQDPYNHWKGSIG